MRAVVSRRGVRRLAYVLVLLIGFAPLACNQKDPEPSEAPPPTGSTEGAPDPQVAKAMEELVAYKARVDRNPQDVDALAAMGNANFSLQRFDHAKEWYERALKVDPKRHATRMDLALALRYLGKPDEAVAQLQRVVAVEPTNAAALYNLGVILLEDKNDSRGAVARFEALMKAHPDHPQTPQLRQMVEAIKHPKTAPAPPPGG